MTNTGQITEEQLACRPVARHGPARRREAMKRNLPYGVYILEDGTHILFNRYYQPLYDRNRWVEGVKEQEWFYKDGNPPWRSLKTLTHCLEALSPNNRRTHK